MNSLTVLSVLLELYCTLSSEFLFLFFFKLVLLLRTRVSNQKCFTEISVTFKASFLWLLFLISVFDSSEIYLQSVQTTHNLVWEEKRRVFKFLFNLQCLLFVTPNL